MKLATSTLIVAALTLAACGGDGSALSGPAITQPGDLAKAPKLSGQALPDLAFTSFDGRLMRLTDLAGSPAVVNIWSETCAPCKQEMPEFEAIHRQVGPRIRFVGINSLDSDRKAREFATRTGVTYDLWRDPTGALYGALKLVALPTTMLLDATGRVVWVKHQRITGDELARKIDELFPA